MAHPAIVELKGIRKSYGIGTPVVTEVLHGIDLLLEHGEFAALIGPSGSGKSTLLNLIGLLEHATAGEIAIAGESATHLDEVKLTELRGRNIGFVFQFHHLLPAFTALENVMMPAIIRDGAPTPQAEATARELLAQGRPGRARVQEAVAAVGRAAAAGGDRAIAVAVAAADTRRRADRQPRHPHRRRDFRTAARIQPRTRQRLPDRHSRPATRRPLRPEDRTGQRQHRRCARRAHRRPDG